MLAATVRVAGDLDLAEECVQDAYARALTTWGRDGVPSRPGAWLTTTARRLALDAHRRSTVLRAKLPLLVEPVAPTAGFAAPDEAGSGDVPDDRLRLVFTCCHPALAPEVRVGLTLRLVCGLSTAEVARALLVSEPTMAARITRAKKKIAAARIPYRVPAAADLPDRLDAVLTVVHLLFTTGHVAPCGSDLVRADLVSRAADLARLLVELMPDEAEAQGLLALVLLTDARRDARTDAAGDVVLLPDQDRSRWDATAVAEGSALARVAWRRSGGRPGRFLLQAAIAAVHGASATSAQTDWPQVLRLYDALMVAWPSPVVALNRAAVVAEVAGPQAALDVVEALGDDDRLQGYHYLPAARAELLRRLGRGPDAAHAYRAALALVDNEAERRFLRRRLVEVGGADA